MHATANRLVRGLPVAFRVGRHRNTTTASSAAPASPSLLSPARAAKALLMTWSASAAWWVFLDPSAKDTTEDGLPLAYEPERIAEFWRARPRLVTRRAVEIATSCVPFACGLAWDKWVRGRLSDPDVSLARAVEMRELVTRLGPTFIKFGQMLSIRPDVLPPPAIAELQKLCDGCPAFDNEVAMATIEASLGRPVGEVFIGLDATVPPVAAASLGQVYKATLRATGEVVAVKVQRPDTLRRVSLDLFLMRRCVVFE